MSPSPSRDASGGGDTGIRKRAKGRAKTTGTIGGSSHDKQTVLKPGVCAWAKMGEFPWWPTVLRHRAEIEPTLSNEDSLPPETATNRLVEFFNDNGRVAVMNMTDLQEYTGCMYLLQDAGPEVSDIILACREADDYIRANGPAFQQRAVGTAFSKIARNRKQWYRNIKQCALRGFIDDDTIDKDILDIDTPGQTPNTTEPPIPRASKPVRELPAQVKSPAKALPKWTVVRRTALKSKQPNSVPKNEMKRGTSSIPSAKRPRVEKTPTTNDNPVSLQLYLKRNALLKSRTAHATTDGGIGDIDLVEKTHATIEVMQQFAAGVGRFVEQKKKMAVEIADRKKSNMLLKAENKELEDLNKILKSVNEQQKSLETHCQKSSDAMRVEIESLKEEDQKLGEKIAMQRKANDELQRWFDDMHDACADLRKERRELRMSQKAKLSID